jgi:hypothetical protein
MKRADLKPGMAVYWVRHRSSVEKFYDDPDDCRYVFDGMYSYNRYAPRGVERYTEDPKGIKAKLTREMPARTVDDREFPAYTDVEYVTLGSILGLYDEVAAERRKLIDAHRDATQRRQEARETALLRRDTLRGVLEGLGYKTRFQSDYSDLDEVHIPVEAMERLLDDLKAAREEAETAYTRGVEVGREAGQGEGPGGWMVAG